MCILSLAVLANIHIPSMTLAWWNDKDWAASKDYTKPLTLNIKPKCHSSASLPLLKKKKKITLDFELNTSRLLFKNIIILSILRYWKLSFHFSGFLR